MSSGRAWPGPPAARRRPPGALPAVAAIACWLAGCGLLEAGVRCALISLDGGGHEQLLDAVHRGVMPELARLIARGALVEGLIPAVPDASTPPSHTSLWTGAPTPVHGITGYSIHPRDQPLGSCPLGFDARYLEVEPLWIPAVRSGLATFLLNVPLTTPIAVYRPGGRWWPGPRTARLDIVQGFDDLRGTGGTLTGTLRDGLASVRIDGRPLEIRRNGASIGVSGPAGEVRLDPPGRPPPIRPLALGPEPDDPRVFLSLVAWDPSSGRYAIYHSPPEGLLSPDLDLHRDYLRATGGFGGQGPRNAYREGSFGAPIPEGGEGHAEETYVELALASLDQTHRGVAYAVSRNPDLLMTYVTQPDEMNHMWTGYLMPGNPVYDAALAARIGPLVDRVLSRIDAIIGTLVEASGPAGHVVVTSDHGRHPIVRRVFVNRVLREAGLVVEDAGGTIDLSRSRIVFACRGSHFADLCLETKTPPGPVATSGAGAVLERAGETLLGLLDPASGRRIFRAVIPVDELGRDAWFGRVTAGDLFLLPLKGTYLESASGPGPLVAGPETTLTGHHSSYGNDPSMRAILVMAGPRVKPGARHPAVSNLRLAPTLARILDIPAPAAAAAPALEELLQR